MDRISKAIELAGEKRKANKVGKRRNINDGYAFSKTKRHGIELDYSVVRRNRIISGFLDNPLADPYRLLRTRVLRIMGQNKWRTLGITSPHPCAGKTLTAINLSIAIAIESNHSALLVDADLRSPNIHEKLGFKPVSGLEHYLQSDAEELDSLFVLPGVDRLAILTSRKVEKCSSELLTGKKMTNLVKKMKESDPSSIAIFDLSPILLGDDAVAFSSCLDAVLMIVEDGKTRSDELRRSFELLDGVNTLGTVLNKAKEPQANFPGYY